MKTADIEIAVAEYFGAKGINNRNIIIPNFRGFWNDYEMDMLIVTPAKYCYEVEIKTSLSDLKADFQKRHFHDSDKVKYFYYAVPKDLMSADLLCYLPLRSGLFVIDANKARLKLKPGCLNNSTLTDAEYLHLGRILTHRLWNAKRKLNHIVELNKKVNR